MPDINWSTLTGCSLTSNNFCEFIFQSNLAQAVNMPTHKHGNTLDIILTDNTEIIANLMVHPLEYQCIPSDHQLITFNICCGYTTLIPVTKEVFDYAKGDYDSLNEFLLNCDFTALYNSTDADEIWCILKDHILIGMNLFIPKVKLRCRQFPVWFTPHLRHLIKFLRTLQHKYIKHPTSNKFQKLVNAQHSFQDASKIAKSNYEQSLTYIQFCC